MDGIHKQTLPADTWGTVKTSTENKCHEVSSSLSLLYGLQDWFDVLCLFHCPDSPSRTQALSANGQPRVCFNLNNLGSENWSACKADCGSRN